MSELPEFILARIAEDEEAARAATPGPWYDDVAVTGGGGFVVMNRIGQVSKSSFDLAESNAEHIARHDPARVLAECEAKRRIVAEHANAADWEPGYCGTCNDGPDEAQSMPCTTLRLLALPYAGHPDYREEWKP